MAGTRYSAAAGKLLCLQGRGRSALGHRQRDQGLQASAWRACESALRATKVKIEIGEEHAGPLGLGQPVGLALIVLGSNGRQTSIEMSHFLSVLAVRCGIWAP